MQKSLFDLELGFTEKDNVEFSIANQAMFDGHRYWWRWREEEGKVVFKEKL